MITQTSPAIYTVTDYDSLVFSAIESLNAASQDLWVASEKIWTLCANFTSREGTFIATICAATGRERSSVYDLLHAWQMRRWVAETYPHFDHALSTSFYHVAYDAKNTMTIDAIAERLSHAAENHLSVREFRDLLSGGELTQDRWAIQAARMVRSMTLRRQDAELCGVDQGRIELMGEAIALWKEALL